MKRQRIRDRDQADAREQAESRAEGLVARLKAMQAGVAEPVAGETPTDSVTAEEPAEPADEDRTLRTGGDPMGDKVPKRPPKPKKPKKPKA